VYKCDDHVDDVHKQDAIVYRISLLVRLGIGCGARKSVIRSVAEEVMDEVRNHMEEEEEEECVACVAASVQRTGWGACVLCEQEEWEELHGRDDLCSLVAVVVVVVVVAAVHNISYEQ